MSHGNVSSELLEKITGVSASEYGQRRLSLANALAPNSVAVIVGAQKHIMSNDIPYRFRQDSNMRYFCGYTEPDAMLLMDTTKKNSDGTPLSTLVVPPRDPAKEKWDGARTSDETLLEHYGIDEVEDSQDLVTVVSKHISGADRIYFDAESTVKGTELHSNLLNLIDDYSRKPLCTYTDSLRLFKSDSEIELMKKACDMTCTGHHDAMAASIKETNCHGQVEEHLLDATVEFGCRKLGASSLSFPPVVAGGNRANTLHYIENNNLIDDGDLVLMDAGAEFEGYCGDVSRTWPINGTFSKAQKEIYQAVLNVQKKCIELCAHISSERPRMRGICGEGTLMHLHFKSLDFMAQELVQLGLIRGDGDLRQQTRLYYPHSIGHFLGMDVHDTPTQPYATVLQPRMIITVEPGLYIPADDMLAPEEFRGIGVRIEDNILLTEQEAVNLTEDCVKEIHDIEFTLQMFQYSKNANKQGGSQK